MEKKTIITAGAVVAGFTAIVAAVVANADPVENPVTDPSRPGVRFDLLQAQNSGNKDYLKVALKNDSLA